MEQKVELPIGQELGAIKKLTNVLDVMPPHQQRRVMNYLNDKYQAFIPGQVLTAPFIAHVGEGK